MYQRLDADGYNQYQDPPSAAGGYAVYQPYDIQEPYYDSFKLASIVVKYGWDFAELTSATSYWSAIRCSRRIPPRACRTYST